MKIVTSNVIVGVGAGIVDTGLIALDENQGWGEAYKNAREWGRIALCLLGFLGQSQNWMPNEMAALAQSEVPLVTKSLADVVRTRVFTQGMASTTRSSFTGSKVMRKTIGQTTKPGFEDVVIY